MATLYDFSLQTYLNVLESAGWKRLTGSDRPRKNDRRESVRIRYRYDLGGDKYIRLVGDFSTRDWYCLNTDFTAGIGHTPYLDMINAIMGKPQTYYELPEGRFRAPTPTPGTENMVSLLTDIQDWARHVEFEPYLPELAAQDYSHRTRNRVFALAWMGQCKQIRAVAASWTEATVLHQLDAEQLDRALKFAGTREAL